MKNIESSKKINIFYISRTSKLTGPENILIDILEEMDKNVFSNTVVLPDDKGPYPEKLKSRGIEFILRRMPFLRVTYNPILIIWFFMNILISNLSFLSVLKREKVDIVVCNTIHEALYVFFPVKILKRKLVICFKNILDRRWKKKLRAKFCDIFADSVIAVSNKTLDDYTLFTSKNRIGSKIVKVIYDGIDCLEFKKNFRKKNILKQYTGSSREIIIINIGNLTELKGQMLLLEAFNLIKDKNLNMKMLFLGDVYHESEFWYKNKIEKYISENNLEGKVVMAGYKKDIRNYLDKSDILVHCPVKDDAFPRVILEAFCFGKIVIATRVGGIPEMIEDGYNGFLCDVDINSLSEKILYVNDNINKLDYIGRNAKKIVREKFGVKTQVMETEEIYYKMLGIKS
jgi:glycosyltransferase involved in cell wall biosynthesis